MKYYPLNLKVEGQRVVVVGGGSVALQKILGLLEAKAQIQLISPEIHSELRVLKEKGLLEWITRKYEKGDLKGAFLAFGATNDREINQKVLEEARQEKIFFNAVDQPELCDFIIPARVRRGEFLLTISTAGEAPFLAKKIRKELEKQFGPEYGLLSKKIQKIRQLFLKQGRGHEISSFLEKYWERMLEKLK